MVRLRRKIPKKYATLVFVFLVALTMSFLMSFALTAINLGFKAEFVGHWLRAFSFAFPVAFVTALLVVPPLRKLVNKITE